MNYLKSFSVGDAWVAVGWSSDVIPAAKRMSNVAVVVPKSGSSLWADLWVCYGFLMHNALPFRTIFFIVMILYVVGNTMRDEISD